LIEALGQKVILNGSVPSILEKPKEDKIRKKAHELLDVFYYGD